MLDSGDREVLREMLEEARVVVRTLATLEQPTPDTVRRQAEVERRVRALAHAIGESDSQK